MATSYVPALALGGTAWSTKVLSERVLGGGFIQYEPCFASLRPKIGAPERGPFSACCGADVKVEACRRSAGKHASLSSATSRPRPMIAVLDLARADYHPVVSSASTRSASRIAAVDEQVSRSPIEAATPQVLFASAVSLP
jgi:hypothetical protein